MAKKHNEFGRLLGTVENDSKPLISKQPPTENGGAVGQKKDEHKS